MAIAATTVWELRATATANNVNGGGFNSALGGTDYTLQDAAQLTNTDLATSGAGATTVTSAGGGFTAAMVGNIMHITAGTNFQAEWYEIVTYTDANNVVLDRTPSSGGAGSGGTFYVGGALSLNSTLDDNFFETVTAGNIIYVKNGTFTIGEAMDVAKDGTSSERIVVEGYNSTRGDNPTGTNRPTLAAGANTFIFDDFWVFKNIIYTTTEAVGWRGDNDCTWDNCKGTNSSGSSNRKCFTVGAAGTNRGVMINCEAVSTNGDAVSSGSTSPYLFGCYIHDSVNGYINTAANGCRIFFTIFDTISGTLGSGGATYIGNTFYGGGADQGTGINLNGGWGFIYNNIFMNLTTAITNSSALYVDCDYNNFYSNTTDRTNVTAGDHDIAVDPAFTDAANGNFMPTGSI